MIGEDAAEVLKISRGTYYRLERGTHRPSYFTAVKLAAWLGWTTDQVMQAADQPALLAEASPSQKP